MKLYTYKAFVQADQISNKLKKQKTVSYNKHKSECKTGNLDTLRQKVQND